MLGSRPFAGVPAILAAGVFVGCQTARPVLPPEPPEARVDDLSPEEVQFAQGLAYYALGLLDDFEGRFDAALTNYLRAVELDASNEELSIRIAMGLLQQDRADEAIRIMEKLVRKQPDSDKALAFLALVYQAAGKKEEVRETFEQWMALAPTSATPYLQYGKFLRRQGDPADVVQVLERGIRQVDEPGGLHLELAKHYLERADQAEDPDAQSAFRRQAMTQLRHAAEYAPRDVNLLRHIGQQAIQLGTPEEALDWFARIEDMRPRDLSVKHKLALDFMASGDPAQGIRRLRQVLEQHPRHRQALYYLGELYLQQDAVEAAAGAFRQAMESDPDDLTAVIRLALIQIEPDPQQAIETLDQGLQHAPEAPRLLELLGHAYLAAGQPVQALEAFAQAQRQLDDPSPPAQFFYHYARAAYLAGEIDQAVHLLWRTLDENLGYLQLFMRESLAASGDGDAAPVAGFFEAFAEAYPEEPAAHLYLGMLRNYSEQFEQALVHFERALSLARAHHRNTQILDEDFYFAYGAAHERTGQIDEAARLFKKALAVDPEHDNAHNYLAYMWAERGIHLEEALKHIQKALALEPHSGPFLDTLGWIYYQQERYAEALPPIEKAAQLTPNDPTITDHLGDVLWQLGRKAEAIERWKESYRLDPENEDVAEKLRQQGVDLEALLADAPQSAADPASPPPEQPARFAPDPPRNGPSPLDAAAPEAHPASNPAPPAGAETNALPPR